MAAGSGREQMAIRISEHGSRIRLRALDATFGFLAINMRESGSIVSEMGMELTFLGMVTSIPVNTLKACLKDTVSIGGLMVISTKVNLSKA